MKIVTKKSKCGFFKTLFIPVLCLGLNNFIFAQSTCNASFTYTTSASSINVVSNSIGVNPYTHFQWVLSNNTNSYIYGDSGIISPLYNGTYTVSLSLSDTFGCSSTTTQTITISGGVNPPACSSSFTYSVGTAGQLIFSNTSPVDPLGQTGYVWDLGVGLDYFSTTLDSFTYYYNGTYVFSLNVYNNLANCSTSSTQTITITNAHPPVACNGAFTYTLGTSGQANFTSSYTGTAPDVIYDWYFGDGVGYSSASSPSYTYAYNGTYTVTLHIKDSLANCNSSITQTISITNSANQPCVATVSFIMHQDSINPQPGIWEISPYYSSQVSRAIWYWGDGDSTTGFYSTHTYLTAGIYHICVKVYAACGDSSITCQNDSLYRMISNTNSTMISVTVLNPSGGTSGISHSYETGQLSIYPNPNNGTFEIETNTADRQTLNIFDVNGRLVLNQTISGKIIIDGSDLNEGVYNLTLKNSTGITNKKLVIVK